MWRDLRRGRPDCRLQIPLGLGGRLRGGRGARVAAPGWGEGETPAAPARATPLAASPAFPQTQHAPPTAGAGPARKGRGPRHGPAKRVAVAGPRQQAGAATAGLAVVVVCLAVVAAGVTADLGAHIVVQPSGGFRVSPAGQDRAAGR